MKLSDYGLKPIDFNDPAQSDASPTFTRRGFLVTSLASGFALALAGGFAHAQSAADRESMYNLREPVTEIARQIYDLHTLTLVICLAIFVAVFGVMFYSIFAHRKSKGAKPASFHESVKVEIAWTVVPFLIVIGMALPATKTVVAMKDTSNADVTIKATGYQWKWGYDYLKGEGEGIGFISTLVNEHRELSNSGAKGAAIGRFRRSVAI